MVQLHPHEPSACGLPICSVDNMQQGRQCIYFCGQANSPSQPAYCTRKAVPEQQAATKDEMLKKITSFMRASASHLSIKLQNAVLNAPFPAPSHHRRHSAGLGSGALQAQWHQMWRPAGRA